MEQFDYRQETDSINEAETKIDSLSEKEAKEVLGFINTLKERSAKKQTTTLLERFNSALLPSLKDFAEITGSLLMVEENKNSCIIAELANSHGFDITESCRIIRAIFVLANQIGIESTDGETRISFILDCTCLE